MKKIPSNFIYHKYGLTVRLVQECDAAFILELRTDKRLSKYLHAVENNLQGQIEWIREYKEREIKGEDYYFIYYSKDKPIGVNRIYNITEKNSTGGSWICSKYAKVEESIATNFILVEISDMFEIPIGPFCVDKGNSQVLKYHLKMGADIIDENDEEYTLICNKTKFDRAKARFVKLLNLQD